MAFNGLVVAFGGTFRGYSQGQLMAKVVNLGGKGSKVVDGEVTHLVTTQVDCDKESAKYKQALQVPNLKIVSLDWLLESDSAGQRKPEASYELANSTKTAKQATATSTKATRASSSQKMPVQNGTVSDDATDDDQLKKTVGPKAPVKATKGKKKSQKAAPANINDTDDDSGTNTVSLAPVKATRGKKKAQKAQKAAPPTDSDTDEDSGTNAVTKAPVKATKGKKKAQKAAPLTGNDTDDDNGSNAVTKAPAKGKKRTRKGAADGPTDTDEEGKDEPPQKKVKDSQKTKSTTLSIPVDEGCNLFQTHRVYIHDDGTIYDAALNQTNVGANNNKFYRIQLLVSLKDPKTYCTWTRWGRVGEHGQTAILNSGNPDDALRQFEKKFRDKSGLSWGNRLDPPKAKKYTFIEKNYEESDDDDDGEDCPSSSKSHVKTKKEETVEATSMLPKPIQLLMELIFNLNYFASTMAAMDYDANKLPLGKLSKRTVNAGFQILKDLAEVLADPTIAQSKHGMGHSEAISQFTNQYYSVIPHSFGRQRPPMLASEAAMKREVELLEALGDMEIANEIMTKAKFPVDEDGNPIHPLDNQYKGLGLREMTPLENKSNEYIKLEEYLIKSHGHTHHTRFKVQDIFRIEREGEFDRFDNSKFANIQNSDRRLLWHGSRCTNFGGILSQGLRIAPPEAPVSGYMFGKGVYLADISSKSANYCCPYLSGNHALILLCEAELGKPMLELYNADYCAGEKAKEAGRLSTWGKGQTGPAGWKDASCVNPDLKGVMMPDTSQPPTNTSYAGAWLQYNEYIVYDIAQIKLRYLLRVEMK